jgi:hypothetical protein
LNTLATDHVPLDEAANAYRMFRPKCQQGDKDTAPAVTETWDKP